jgi:hypothetical protein
MRAYNTRESKLRDLFDFYMDVTFGSVHAQAECPFPVQRSKDASCYSLCGLFFDTGYSCPCCALGPGVSMDLLEKLLVKEGFIPDESK